MATALPATDANGSCATRVAISTRPRTVSVDGVAIARADIAREAQYHPAATPFEAWKAAARALVIRRMLLNEAGRLGLVPAPLGDGEGRRETDEEALVRQVVEREVITPQADGESCRRYYDNNLRRFCSPALFEARHILLAAAPDDAEARRSARETALALIDRLDVEPELFAALATRHSACPSRSVGGSLGQIGPGQTVPEFERALAQAPQGIHAAQPCQTRYGFHVLRVERRIDGRQLPFDQVQPKIAAWLEEKVRRAAIRQYITILAAAAEITGIDLTDPGTGASA